MNYDDGVILLTGTITPNTFKTLALQDPEVRKKQYLETIEFYLFETNLKIVFTENSGQSLQDYFKDYSSRLEFLTYRSPILTPDKGKGFKELEIIDYSMRNSKFINNSKSIIKITGRLKILNINKLVKSYKYANKKKLNLISFNVYKRRKMDARCFIFSKNFWNILVTYWDNVNINYSIEMALWDSTREYIAIKNNNFTFLNSPSRVVGINAGFGNAYDYSLKMLIIKKIRHKLMKPLYLNLLKK